jgi:2-(1,2-epoxy-1,2-dihydrophenyl)acetyl-CoA isomerase
MSGAADSRLVRTELRADGVLVVRLADEKTRNSLTHGLRAELGAAFDDAGRDARVRAVFLTGQGRSFCSGGDLRMLEKESDPWSVHRRFRALASWFLAYLQMEKPVVVGVNGHAVGGGIGLALGGDLVIASESARFIPGFFRLGVVPDVGMMYLLPRLIGMAKAKQFLFSNEALSARQALDLGLVARVVPDADIEKAGLERASELAGGPTAVMGLSKLLMARSFETGLSDMFLIEGLGQALAQSSADFAEGLSALRGGRTPLFNQGADELGGGDPGGAGRS